MNEDKVKKDIEEIWIIGFSQVNQKSIEIFDLNVSLQEKDLVITALKDELRKLKGKDIAGNVVTKHAIALEMLKIDVEYLNPRLLHNRSAHSDYLKHTQEEAVILREIVEQGKLQNPLNNSLDSTGVRPSTSASGSQPSGNTTKDKIHRTPSSTQKNKVVAYPRTCNGCMLSNNHDLCILDFINDVNACNKSKSVKKSSKEKSLETNRKSVYKYWIHLETYWITTTAKVPLRKPTAPETDTPKPV
ncbi:hypothetical protein Tco_1512474, partial [Tanacetum coccineum]